MGWWSNFRDSVLKPVAGVVLLGNILGGGGGGGIFGKLFGGGSAATSASTAAGLNAATGTALPGILPGAGAANVLSSLGAGAATAGATGAAAGGLLGKGLGSILGGNSALTTALLMGTMGKSGMPKIETPQLDATSQALKNKLIDTTSSQVGQYQNAYNQFNPTTLNAYLEDLKNKQERAQQTGFKPINTL